MWAGTPTITSSQPPGQSDDGTSSQAPEATVPNTPEEKIQNHSMERESRIAENKLKHSQLLPKTVDFASDVNSQVT